MESKYLCKIIYVVDENEDAISKLKEVPYFNPSNNIYDFLSGPAGNMMCASFEKNNHLSSFVIPSLKGDEIVDYIHDVMSKTDIKIYVCGWDGKSKSIHVWTTEGSDIIERDVDEENQMNAMKGYLQFDDPSSYDDLIDSEKYTIM